MSMIWEQMESAAVSLARGGAIKDRLIEAYRNHLSQVDAAELPENLRGELQYCHEALTRESPQRGEDAVRATVRKMSNQEAEELACGVVRLFAAVLREAVVAPQAAASAEPQLSEVVIGTVRPKLVKSVGATSVPRVIERYAAEA